MTTSTLAPFRSFLITVTALCLLIPASLPAQNSGCGFIKAQAGSTVLGTSNSLVAAAGFGLRLNRSMDLFAEAGTLSDARDHELTQRLTDLSAFANNELGIPLDLDRPASSRYVLFGARITVPLKSVFNPFFEIAGGAASLSLRRPGFIPSFVLTEIVNNSLSPYYKPHPLLSLSGGAHLAVTQSFGIDIGMRHFRGFTQQNTLSSNQLFAGIVYRF